jgi:hypothetical protein
MQKWLRDGVLALMRDVVFGHVAMSDCRSGADRCPVGTFLRSPQPEPAWVAPLGGEGERESRRPLRAAWERATGSSLALTTTP